ncbi:MAG TPA: GNAT family N-acetyltransferase [Vicinamibacterales bacterium]|nr:GNAT family N-acetyltransferase [Vicinamibacterales bacterium]
MTNLSCWLTTDRLALRRFTAADLDWLAELYNDHEVTRYLGGVKSRPQVASFLNVRILRYYDEHPGFGIWMTVERASGTAVGFHLLNRIRGEAIIQVGFVLARSAWRTGFATEMAGAVVRYGFVDLNLPRIAGIASLRNHASQRVLEKIGLERRGERAFVHPDYVREGPMAWFEREGDAWRAERAAAVTGTGA